MHSITDLAMSQTSSNQMGFDLKKYLKCKQFLQLKDQIIASRVAERLQYVCNGKGTVSVLDVGTGEASLIDKILSNYRAMQPRGNWVTLRPAYIDCIEPEEEAGEYIRTLAKRMKRNKICINQFDMRVQEYLRTAGKRYDIILCIHALYHIAKQEWLEVIEQMLDHIDGGCVILNLVSQRSPIYRLLEDIEPILERHSVRRTWDTCGELYFAEQLEGVVSKLEVEIERIDIEGIMEIRRAEIEAAGRGVNADTDAIVELLAFMYRVETEDLWRVTKWQIKEFIKPYIEKGSIATLDKMFILRRKGL